jgi:hypothetical protein
LIRTGQISKAGRLKIAQGRPCCCLRQPDLPPDPAAPRVVMIGNFDGFHRGHQAVAQAALEVAEGRMARSGF